MKTRKILMSLVFLSLSFALSAQADLRKIAMDSGGGVSAAAGNIKIVFTTGEVANGERTAGNIHVSEGFIGPDFLDFLNVENYDLLEGVSIFPNPVTDYLTVSLPENKSYEFHLFDLTGKQLLFFFRTTNRESIDVRRLNTGVYVLVIIDRENQRRHVVKIRKK